MYSISDWMRGRGRKGRGREGVEGGGDISQKWLKIYQNLLEHLDSPFFSQIGQKFQLYNILSSFVYHKASLNAYSN